MKYMLDTNICIYVMKNKPEKVLKRSREEMNSASVYGEIRENLQRAGTPIGPLEMLIAAHAKAEGLILVTNNVKEFERVLELKIENWT